MRSPADRKRPPLHASERGARRVKRAETKPPSMAEALGYFWRLLRLTRSYWPKFGRSVALGAAISVLGLITPMLTKLLIDQVYPTRDVAFMHTLVLAILVLGVSRTALGSLRSLYAQLINVDLGTSTTQTFFNHLQHLPTHFYDRHRVGEIISRFQDVRGSVNTIGRILEVVLLRGLYLLLVPPILLLMDWRLTLVALVFVPVTVAIAIFAGPLQRSLSKKSSEAVAELHASHVELLGNVRMVKGAVAERQAFDTTKRQAEDAARLQLRAMGLGTAVGTLSGVVRAVGVAVFTWYAWTLILRGELTIGAFIAFSAYLGYLTGPISQFTALFTGFQQSAVNLARMFEYLDEVPERDPSLVYRASPPELRVTGTVRVDDVSFAYDTDRLVLDGIRMELEPGSLSAIMGPSGSGKSTLARLIAGMALPRTGSVVLGGLDTRREDPQLVRRQVATVWQELGFIRGTLWDNLTFGLPDADPSAVNSALEICDIHNLVHALPDGLDALVSEWGTSLSGGERQRIALARAVLRSTPILILDEALSQVGVDQEIRILERVIEHLRGSTILVITHRPKPATLTDRVFLLEAGRLAAEDTHERLLLSSSSYRRIHAEGRPAHSAGDRRAPA